MSARTDVTSFHQRIQMMAALEDEFPNTRGSRRYTLFGEDDARRLRDAYAAKWDALCADDAVQTLQI